MWISEDGIKLLFDHIDIPSCFFRGLQLFFNAVDRVDRRRVVLPVEKEGNRLQGFRSQFAAKIHDDLSRIRVFGIPSLRQ